MSFFSTNLIGVARIGPVIFLLAMSTRRNDGGNLAFRWVDDRFLRCCHKRQ